MLNYCLSHRTVIKNVEVSLLCECGDIKLMYNRLVWDSLPAAETQTLKNVLHSTDVTALKAWKASPDL